MESISHTVFTDPQENAQVPHCSKDSYYLECKSLNFLNIMDSFNSVFRFGDVLESTQDTETRAQETSTQDSKGKDLDLPPSKTHTPTSQIRLPEFQVSHTVKPHYEIL